MPIQYPDVRKDETVVEDLHGVKIADPYRWLEDPDAEDIKQFVEAQNKVTLQYLEGCKPREIIKSRLTELWNHPKYGCPFKRGGRYFCFKNTGLQNQSVLYMLRTLDEEGEVFLDPNTLSEDGTVAISKYSHSRNGEVFAYGLSGNGSDWITVHFKNVLTGESYPETLEKVKSSPLAWTHDNKGGAKVSHCGNYLIISPMETSRDNLVYFADLVEPLKCGLIGKLALTPVVTEFEAVYEYVTNEGSLMYFRTSKNAPNYHIVSIDLSKPISDNSWTVVVPEHEKNVLEWSVCVHSDVLITCCIEDVKNTLQIRRLQGGSLIKDFTLEVGTIVAYSGQKLDTELFFQFASFLTPTKIFQVDLKSESVEITVTCSRSEIEGIRSLQLYKFANFLHKQRRNKSPMFIVHRKDLVLNGNNPCLLYGYGGFNTSVQPTFSVCLIVLMQHLGGVVAVANIRGGGEYGEKWHNGGRLENKQNGFDDFQAAATYLVDNNYTCSRKITIQGASNGGLLVGACVNQRPDLFGAAIAQVGVMDMLRFHKFTVGYAWCSDYGSPDEEKHFKNLLKYSPLLNIKLPDDENIQYPAMLLPTADHDDRVVPLHSFKFISEIQDKIGRHPRQTNPLLIRIEKNAGHGAGKPTAKIIEEHTDILSIMTQTIGLEFTP